MRIRRDPGAADFLPEVVHLRRREAAEHERPRVHAGRGVALHEHEIAAVPVGGRVPEMVEADVVEHRRGREARDVAADVRVLVRAEHHRHRVPADEMADLLLDVEVAGEPHLLLHRDRVDVRGVRGERQVRAGPARLVDQGLDEEMRPVRTFGREHPFERSEPLLRFLRIQVGNVVHAMHLRSYCRPFHRQDLNCIGILP